jgi:uncharacterized protein (UPF0548 family)
MLSLPKPSADAVRRFLAEQAALSLTYEAVGATAGTPPTGYDIDRTRVSLGRGEPVFRSAAAALQRWDQFRLGWVEPWPGDTPIRVGEVLAVMGRAIRLWWVNACRIVYVVEETGTIAKFGFAYGTLPSHAESGEERFLVEWDQADDRVWYEIVAFSRPHHFLSRLGYPAVRRVQKRFRRDSAASMLQTVRFDCEVVS